MFISEVAEYREDCIDAFMQQDVVPENCPCTQGENIDCPGHCPLCTDPVDYCQGHSPTEWQTAALAWISNPGPLSLFIIDDTCSSIHYHEQSIGYAVLHEGITSGMQWTVVFRVGSDLYYCECLNQREIRKYLQTIGEMIDE